MIYIYFLNVWIIATHTNNNDIGGKNPHIIISNRSVNLGGGLGGVGCAIKIPALSYMYKRGYGTVSKMRVNGEKSRITTFIYWLCVKFNVIPR